MSAGQTTRSRIIRQTLKERERFPSRSMIVCRDGTATWPQPDESPLAGEILIGAWDFRWTVGDVELALDRAYVGCKVVAS